MLELRSGDKNTIEVDGDTVSVEFNPRQKVAYRKVFTDLCRMLGKAHEETVFNVISEIALDSSLWTTSGKWRGPYSKSIALK
jgi:hypothetical protein